MLRGPPNKAGLVVKLAALVVALATALAGCASGSPAKPDTSGGATRSTRKTAAPTPSAAVVVRRLRAAGIPIGHVTVYDAANDPNKLLGRPGQYVSKAQFADRRADGQPGEVSAGGSVETFASSDDSARRDKYVKAIAKSSALFAEYDYRRGAVLLRVSSRLTPSQASRYAAALTRVAN